MGKQSEAAVVHAVFYRTYMPPRSLLVQPLGNDVAADNGAGAWLTGLTTGEWDGIPPLGRLQRSAGRWQQWNVTAADRRPANAKSTADQSRRRPGRGLRLTDLAGASIADLRTALSAAGCYGGLAPSYFSSRKCISLLVAPVTAAEAAVAAWRAADAEQPRLELELVWSFGPHLSTEEIEGLVAALRERGAAGLWGAMRLGVYRVRRK
eukprot:CAMPEP_0197588244 /NCGR_PEP_ID=MMETSP1326-20131121/9596_1 /TAXON_ID=1155430 /ORGANISM="Genus nov. species nov., Strain RCC2288" /LENGTH=207 /DNA_ID=CAMNT_0043153047 /DNA_START=13 /DNA_END=639 /DNA_ORIENTATION=-